MSEKRKNMKWPFTSAEKATDMTMPKGMKMPTGKGAMKMGKRKKLSLNKI